MKLDDESRNVVSQRNPQKRHRFTPQTEKEPQHRLRIGSAWVGRFGIVLRICTPSITFIQTRLKTHRSFIGPVKESNASSCCDRGHYRRAVDLYGSSQRPTNDRWPKPERGRCSIPEQVFAPSVSTPSEALTTEPPISCLRKPVQYERNPFPSGGLRFSSRPS